VPRSQPPQLNGGANKLEIVEFCAVRLPAGRHQRIRDILLLRTLILFPGVGWIVSC
jgi:hypothetical protein